MRKIFLFAVGAMMLTACSKSTETSETGNAPVQFTTSITRVTGTTWDDGDKIGVFMKTAGADIATSATLNAANVPYITNSATFTSSTPIYYPLTGTVDFVAYYPWRELSSETPYIYKVDVSSQTDFSKIDLLYSDNAANKSVSSTPVSLQFSHRLSKITLNVVKGAGMDNENFANLGVTITGMPTQVDFLLADGSFAEFGQVANLVPQAVTSGEMYEAIIIPQEANVWSNRAMLFTIEGQTYTYKILNTVGFDSGKNYTYTITINKTGVSISVDDITDWDSDENEETGTAEII